MFGAVELAGSTNHLLSGLSETDRRTVAFHGSLETLSAGARLEQAGQPVTHMYFLTSGVASLIARPRGSDPVEIAIVGSEGATGLGLVLGDPLACHDCLMQTDGGAFILASAAVDTLCGLCSDLHKRLLRYTRFLMMQLAETARANVKGNVQQRLARWLLMYQDRLGTQDLPLTHELMSLMLGVRRASVTVALHQLEGAGWIRARRRLVSIENRRALEEFCRSLYGGPEQKYRDLGEHQTEAPEPEALVASKLACS